ncbi:hypothetical protein [Alteraurantiacibacter aquimixticola]|uniref:LysR family transcriptional regulator n=1 Tax=Alteraurantiacibacter aquimixticola TaxID=2489173 RepID=A0A4V4U8E3_9SPHN|nr:hypothetical protein [Alteraurantiacibacter aquimixticola]TIX49560.1 hypothetical protein E5222_12015 [Alteraurantiacibacter aquimixticola]
MTRTRTLPPPRIPRFAPVPLRARSDGWTPLRQAEFIGMLAQTGSVAAAARFVGMARETAYRLRRRAGAEEFAWAWDVALAYARRGRPPAPPAAAMERRGPRKVTHDEPWRAIVDGRWRVVMRRGRYCGSVRESPNSALLSWLAQIDRAMREGRKALRRRAAKDGRSQSQEGACVFQAPSLVAGPRLS